MMDKAYDILNKHTATFLAKYLGVSRQTASRYKDDPERVPIGIVRKIAKLDGYKIEFIRTERRWEY